MKINIYKVILLVALGILGLPNAKAEFEGFDDFNVGSTLTLPAGWDYYGTPSNFYKGFDSGEYKSKRPSIGVSSKNTDCYIITPMLEGDFDFFIRNYSSRYIASVKAYACSYVDGQFDLGEELGSKELGSGTSFVNVAFKATSPTRVALLISQAYFDDFTYTPFTPKDEATLVVTGYPNGSEYDFGTVAAGTEKKFTLVNQGGKELEIESIKTIGDFVLSDNLPTAIPAGESVEITVSTPAKNAEGNLTINSNDKESPYVIILKSIYKVPKPILSVAPVEINFGKVNEDKEGKFTVSNSGDATLEVTLSSDNTAFGIDKSALSIEPGQSEDVNVTFHYNADVFGVNAAKITLHPNDGEDVVVNAYARVADPSVWSEEFSASELPAGWEADADGWTFSDGVAKGKYVSYSSKYYLTTPELTVVDGDEMEFQYRATANYVSVKIQYSKDGGEFVDYQTISNLNKMDNFADYTIKGLEAGSYRFRFQNDDYELDNFEGFKLNANAPRLEVSPVEDAVFGKVLSQPESKKYTVRNIGTGELSVSIASSSDDFTVEPAELTVLPENPAEFTVTFNYDIESLGEKKAVITVTPSYNVSKAVSFNASAIAKDPNHWDEDFEEGKIPEGWSHTGWVIEKSNTTLGNGTYMAYAGTQSPVPVIITPRLVAYQGQELNFEIGDSTDKNDPMTVEYSHDQDEWTPIEGSPITSGGTYTFTAPENGYYYLRFQGKYGRIDNFSGFKLGLKDHDISISGQTIPTQGNQYVEYVANVSLTEMTGKEEMATVTLFFNDEEMATAETVMQPNATSQIRLSFTPNKAYEDVVASVVVKYADGEVLRGEKVNVNILEAPVWNENGTYEFEEETIPALVFEYTVSDGWNSICVPFALDDAYLSQIFGDDHTVYELKQFEDNIIKFQEATQYNGKYAAGYPYIVFIPVEATSYNLSDEEEEPSSLIILKDVKIERATPQEDGKGTLGFKGSFESADADDNHYEIEAETGSLTKAASIQAFRAYISLDPQMETLPEVKYYDGAGVETGVKLNYMNSEYPKGIFNLNGIRVKEPLAPGIYIIDGKKVILDGNLR